MPAENNITTTPQQPIPPPSTEALALARLRQKAISHPLQQCQLTIYVPPNAVGAIIGRGGRTILSVQQEAKRRSLGHDMGVRIHVVGGTNSNNNNNNSSAAPSSGAATWNYNEYQQQQQQQQQQNESDNADDWVPVTIRGDPIGCLEACRLIIPLVDRPQDPTYLTIVLDVPIHRAKHNLLVGKGGIVLAFLSATYETRIMIPPNELMSNVESTGNIWEQRQQQQQQQQVNASNDAGATMLFDLGSGGEAGSDNNIIMSQSNSTTSVVDLISNIIQLEGELDNVEECLVRMLQIVAMEEKVVPTGTIVDCDSTTTILTDHPSTTTTPPPKKSKNNDKAAPAEKTVATAIIVADDSSRSLSSRTWRSVMRKTNTKIQRKALVDVEPLLVNEIIDDVEGGDDDVAVVDDDAVDNDDGDKEETAAAAARPHTKFIITGKSEQSVQKACAQLEKLLGLEVGSTEVTVKVVPVEVSPMGKADDQSDKEGASGKKVRKRRGKKKAAAAAQPD
eukprot:CAMPEP_0201689386 /NCGR_PEP_ID=MMETSP0578-20130828/2992_1 /ASSEMBLY_ACC=CAM_ASM_000663 /TAXON_ID=267565 /ORGANISM="Skeletonema grethea, Strain CCMP 1804" /LENGTH=505 /DNA_ID=CAMNT_0048174015 /DNA_START=156 /DNA_END=1673 /DNA_ORIENTATION=-